MLQSPVQQCYDHLVKSMGNCLAIPTTQKVLNQLYYTQLCYQLHTPNASANHLTESACHEPAVLLQSIENSVVSSTPQMPLPITSEDKPVTRTCPASYMHFADPDYRQAVSCLNRIHLRSLSAQCCCKRPSDQAKGYSLLIYNAGMHFLLLQPLSNPETHRETQGHKERLSDRN